MMAKAKPARGRPKGSGLKPVKCLTKGCCETAQVRGLCWRDYQEARRELIRDNKRLPNGDLDWSEFEKAKRIMPSRKGQGAQQNAFKKQSELLKARKSK